MNARCSAAPWLRAIAVCAVGVISGVAAFLLLPIGALLLLACAAAFGIRGWRRAFAAGWITGLVSVLVLVSLARGWV